MSQGERPPVSANVPPVQLEGQGYSSPKPTIAISTTTTVIAVVIIIIVSPKMTDIVI